MDPTEDLKAELARFTDPELLKLARTALDLFRERRILQGLELDMGSGDSETGGLVTDFDAELVAATVELRRAVERAAGIAGVE